MDWTTPELPREPSPRGSEGRWKRYAGGAALVGAGLVAGGVLMSTVGANAAASSTPSNATYAASADGTHAAHDGRGGQDLADAGTVTSVGPSSVTIRSASGSTTTYQVSSSSDIDKNGEAQLSDLKPGDAVRFSTSGTTIDKLHAGNESLDRPAGGPGPGGSTPSGSSSSG